MREKKKEEERLQTRKCIQENGRKKIIKAKIIKLRNSTFAKR
jgi:hypothetical protein